MMLSLYDAVVPTQVQILGAVIGWLDKAEAHCAAQGLDAETILSGKLAPDMFDFAYQVKSTWVHSLGGIEGVQRGWFSPDQSEAPRSFAGLKDRTRQTIEALQALDAAALENVEGKVVEFRFGDKVGARFDGGQFLLTFSQPNFFFHASMAYAVLRSLGVEVGKRDFMGAARRLEQ